MASSRCLIHFEGEGGPLSHFTEVSFTKFINLRTQWLTLDGLQRQVAEETIQTVPEDCPTADCDKFFYHRGCYSKFTNISLLDNAIKRCSRGVTATNTTATNEDELPRKTLRSSISQHSYQYPSINPHVLPPVCVICNEEKSYFTDPVSFF